MKRNCKRLTALVLAMAMSLSMLSPATWAADVSVDEEEVISASLTTDAEEPTDDEKEDTNADAAGEAAEEPTTEETAAEESTEEPAEEAAADPAQEAASEDEAEAIVTALEDEAEEETNNEEENTDEGEEEEDYSVGNGVAYTLEDGVLTIYRTDEEDQDGRMWDWDDGDSPFAWRDDITSIVIEDGVTYIGSNAFHGCSVESLSIGADVEDINFGDGAFVWCIELSSIEVSEDNGTYATQDGVLFQKDDEGNLSELKLYPVGNESASYEIPDGVWYIEQWAFFQADSLESVTIPYSVEDIGFEAFKNCYSLMSVTVPDTVTGIGDRAFGWGDSDDEGDLVTLDGFILYGYSNTQAQWYAEDNGVTFVALDDENAEGEGDFGQEGDNLHWVLSDGVLTISLNEGYENGWMDDGDWGRGDAPWYDMRHSINEVVLEDGVENIGNYAFYTCTNLSDVTVADSVCNVESWAFAQCPNLGSVELSNNVEWIGDRAFYRSGLTEFTIPNNSGLTEIFDGTFQGTNLESISIPRRITSIGYAAFQDCDSLTEVTFTGTSKLSYIGDSAFRGCSSLTSIEIPSGVTTIEDWAFQGCTSLESVTLPDDEDFTRVPSGMFSDCESLTSVTIPDSVTEIGNDAFANCTSLESVNIPDGVDYICSWTFYNCSSLDGVTLPDGVTCIEDEAFRDCSSLTSINMPESLTQICWAAFAGCSSLAGDLVIPDSACIDSEAFYGCSSLTSVTLPNNDEYTGIAERTFQYCSGLTSVTIPDTVTWIGGSAFEGCTSLEYIELPDSVDTIEWWAFAYCPLTQLEDDTLVISENVGWIGDHAFYGCGFNNVIIYSTEIGIDGQAFGWDGNDEEDYGPLDGFTVYGYSDTEAQWYAENNDLTFVGLDWEYEGQCGDNVYWTLEDGVLTIYTEGEAEDEDQSGRMWGYDNWDDSPFGGRGDITAIVIEDGVTYIGCGAFQNCYNVESLYLGADVEDINFGGGAFVWCTSLSTIEVSENNETFSVEDDVLFRDEGSTLCLYPSCKEGNSYTIPDGVVTIEQWAFYHNENLTSVTIPESVRYIGYEAFYNCINLWEVTIPDTVDSIDYHAFGFADQEDEDGNWFEEMDGFTVYGYENTEAQDYADRYDSVNFVALEIPTVNEGGEFGTNLYWSLNEDGTLTISVVDGAESGTMDFETVGDAPWYEYRLSVNNVVIETGVEGIDTGAFYNCINLESVDIQADIAYIDSGAFAHCRSLGEITIPDSVTSIGDTAFMNCQSLGEITIPDSVTSIGAYAFLNCYNLESVTLPNNDEFTEIAEGTFFSCWIPEITIPDSVTSIGDVAFFNTGLTEITIPDSVTYIGSDAFNGCGDLASVTLPNNDEFTEISGYLFYDCGSLTEITIPETVTYIGECAFYNTGMNDITIPASVEEIGDMAFGYYWYSEEVYDEENDESYWDEYDAVVDNFTIYGYTGTAAEDYANNNEPIIFVALDEEEGTVVDSGQCGDNVYWKLYEDGTLTIYTEGEAEDESQNGRIWDYGMSPFTGRDDITSVVIEDGVTYVGSYTFWNCESLTSATLPDGVDAIGEGAFQNCTSLESINIPDSVTSIGDYSFIGCCNMTELVIPDSVTYIGDSAFSGCSSLQSVTLPNNDEFTKISDGTFYECTSLESIVIPDSVTTIGASAFYSSGLTEIVIPDSVTYIDWWVFTNTNLTEIVIPDSVTHIGDRTFYNCTSLTSVTLPDNEEFTEICEGTFNNCSSLESIVIPDSVTTIGSYAFQGCTSLTSVTLPDSGESTEIGEGAFYGCYSLGEVTIPDSVTSIGSWAFFNNAFTEITIPVSVEEIGDKALGYRWTNDSDDNTALIEGFLIRGHAGTAAETYANDNGIDFEGIHFEGEAVIENEAEATCTEDGSYDTVVYCTYCDEEMSRETTTIPATGHSYGEAVFSWTDDNTATAAFTCDACGDVQTVDAEVTSETTEATCTEDGETVYTATVTFEDKAYSDTKTETIPATGHTEGEAVTENEVAATCTEDGSYDSVVYCTVCGEELSRETVTVPATGHSYGEAVFTWAEDYTATAAFTCDSCGDVQTVDAEVTSETTDATCTEDGETVYTATVTFEDKTYSDTKTETVPATGHTDGEAVKENEVAATCTEDGSYDSVVYCTVCGEEISRETVTVPAVGHSYEAVVTEPTCTEGGYTTYTCTVCGDTYTADKTDALGHTWDEGVVTKEATCEENGERIYTCTVCGETYTEVIPATDHAYGEPTFTWAEDYSAAIATFTCEEGDNTIKVTAEVTTQTTQPTCTETGKVVYTATALFNGETYTDEQTEEIEATGHTEGEAVKENEVAATCTEDGSYDSVVYCTVCGEELSRETVTVPATGHSYEAVVTEPTCTEGGYTTYTCTVCGDTYTADKTDALGHTEGEAVKENEVAATCTEDGSYDSVIYCTVCGAEISRETVTVPATGHSYGEAVFTWADDYTATAAFTCDACGDVQTVDAEVTSETTNATCTEDGETVYTATVTFEDKTYSDTKAETIPATGHDYEAVVTEPTCTEGGYTTYTCTVCGTTYTADETDALGHTEGEAVKENEVAATCTEDGSYDSVIYCTVCGEEISRETVTVPASHTEGEAVKENEVEATCTEDGSYDNVIYCTVCGAEISREAVTVPATGHTEGEAVKENEVAATCTEDGSYDSVIYCTVCGAEISRETVTVPATGHSYEAVVTEPTCTEGGYTTYTCTVCGNTYTADETDALGHTWDEGVVTKEATCEENGERIYTCTVCGETYTEVIPATGHSYDEGVVTEPTCTEGGYTTYTCTVCGTTYIADETDALGHTWDEGVVTKEATCEENGERIYTCTVCGETYTEVIPATDHTYGEPTFTWAEDYSAAIATFTCEEGDNTIKVTAEVTTQTTQPTCTETGKVVYTATALFNGETYTDEQTEEIEATGHTEGEAVIENEVAATCIEDGSYDSVVYCTVCGEELNRETVTVSATGHDYEAVVTEPTCTEDGYTTYTCTVCGDSYIADETEALGHSYNAGVVTEPTCTEGGYTTYTCTVCGDTYIADETEATGHTEGEAVKENEVAATCTEDGSYDSVVYCTVCGEEISRETVTVPATGHDYEAVVTEPTCTEGGYTTYTCTVCGDTYTADETEALGHTWDAGVVTKEATATEDGVMTYTCTVCGETKTEAIPATGAVDLTTGCTLTLSTSTYTYDGTAKTPTVTVKDAEGNTLTEGVDYTVSYSDNTAVGTATVTVTGIGSYTGTATATFTIEEAAQEPSGDQDDPGDTSGDTSGDQSGTEEQTVPAATKITSAVNKAKGIKLTWNAVDGATSYQVYRKVGNGSWKKVKTTTATSWTDTSATKNGTKYQYKVYAVNDAGKSSASATKTIYRLTAKHFTRAKNVCGKKISLKWTRNTKATGYIIQYSTCKNFSSSTTKTVKIKGNKNLTTTLKNLKKGKTYYIRMRPYKTSGSVTSYAGWSKVKKVKVTK